MTFASRQLPMLALIAISIATTQPRADEDRAIGKNAFESACASCHSDNPVPRAPSLAQLAKMPPEKIFDAQTIGLMVLQASALNELEKRALSIYLSEIPWGSVAKQKVAEDLPMCENAQPVSAADFEQPHWNGWGLDTDNTHFQPGDRARVSKADLENLELKWSFGFPGATGVTTQPAVLGDRLFLGSPSGAVYSLDKRTGCAHWKFDTEAEVRAAITLVPGDDGAITLYAGDRKAWLYALDANTGELKWKDRADEHEWAVITASPVVHKNKLYIALASFEELAGGSVTYECCTFRGSVVKYDLATGKRDWKQSLVPEPLVKTKKLSNGTQLWGPSGVAVWSQPTIDETAGVLYVTTGDSYSAPASSTSDAVVALSLATGEIVWSVQTTADDAFTTACVSPNADPVSREECGPDVDFGSSAILRTLPDGKRILLAGQKSGVMHALDPDNKGAILWQKRLSPGGVLGGIEWGFAADNEHLYVPISDVWETRAAPGHAGGIYKLKLADGAEVWNIPAAAPDCLERAGCNAGQPAAATLIPGIIFSAAMDGHMRAYDSVTGKVLWDVNTDGSYDTVNKVAASGGSIKGAGATVVDGWVYFGSGYGLFGMPGNVFLAYGPK
ncbi:MAG: PQQ-binding-like beta-propeller repeat protein [Gammaproteobacteria bacterium]